MPVKINKSRQIESFRIPLVTIVASLTTHRRAWISNAFVLHSPPFFSPLEPETHLGSSSWLKEDTPFDACWEANAVDLNPSNDTKIELILQRLCSPAPQGYFVVQRALDRETEQRVETLGQLQYLLKPDFQWAISEDTREVDVIPTNDVTLADGWSKIKRQEQQSVLEMSHDALDLAFEDERFRFKDLVLETKNRLSLTLGTDIRGRTSADAAFSFAMAGVADQELYELLATVASKELERVGRRPSFRSKYILQIVEKLAAAGLRGTQRVFQVAAECLNYKGEHADIAVALLSGEFDLMSERPLLWIWRFSSKQSKLQPFMMADVNDDSSWMTSFDDPEQPLVVDIGCGMGVSLLGLTTGDDDFAATSEGKLIHYSDWRDSNFVGCDLSTLNLGFARGISRRWNLEGRLRYVCTSAQKLLDGIDIHYWGRVPLVMIQFPSPFRFSGKSEGNTQLPEASGFMVSEHLLRTAARVLGKGGLLLVQSNVEDVAMAIRERALTTGFESVLVPNPQITGSIGPNLPQRTLDWVEAGGELAAGNEWSSVPLLPCEGATETEIECSFQGTPVHRCLFRVTEN